jgi:hypothetical protein
MEVEIVAKLEPLNTSYEKVPVINKKKNKPFIVNLINILMK